MRLFLGMWQTLSRLTGLTGYPGPQGPPDTNLDRNLAVPNDSRLTWGDLPALFGSLARGKISLRRKRLLACGACRLHWNTTTDARLRRAIELSEHHADGLISEEQMQVSSRETEELVELRGQRRNGADDLGPIVELERAVADLARGEILLSLLHAWQADCTRQKDWLVLIRDLLQGTMSTVTVQPTWKKWNDQLVEKVARTIYDEARFDELPILADALEEAGCDHPLLLSHLRSPGPHYRGCWALDWVLEHP